MIRKTIAALGFTWAVLMSNHAFALDGCDVGAPYGDTAPQMAAWEFLIGNHEVDFILPTEDGTWGEPVAVAQWNGWWGLGGRALIDEWFGPSRDGGRGNDGVNVRVWNEEAQVWRMTWQQTRNSVAAIYEARIEEDGLLHMWQVMPEEETQSDAWFEITGPDTWSRIQRSRNDEGEWQMDFRLDARRQACDSR